MKGAILSIDVDGSETIREIDGEPELDVLKDAIGGGYLEAVPYFNSYKHEGELHECVAFCDEEGKLNELPYNRTATIRWQEARLRAGRSGLISPDHTWVDYLAGKVAVVWGDREFMEAL